MSVGQLLGTREDYSNTARLGQKKSKAAAAAAAAAAAPEPPPEPEKQKPPSVREIKDKVTEIKGQVNEFEFLSH